MSRVFLLWDAKKSIAFFSDSVYIVVLIQALVGIGVSPDEWKVYAVNDVNNRVLVAEF